jgi:hypothetical protein
MREGFRMLNLYGKKSRNEDRAKMNEYEHDYT